MRKIFTLLGMLMLTTCSQNSHFVNGEIQEKTVYIRTGKIGVIGDLKTELRNHGWKIYGSPQRTVEQQGESKAVTYIGNAKYSLNWEYRTRDRHMLTWKPILDISLSLVDNSTGEEILSYEAKYTEQTKSFKEFMDLLDKSMRK